MISPDHLWLLLLALALDAAMGDPPWLWRYIPHPVVMLGALISLLERIGNRQDRSPAFRKAAGIAALAVLLIVAWGTGWLLETAFNRWPFGWIGTVVVAAILLAGRSLYDHVAAIASALERDGLPAARREIAKIVGRDPEALDEPAIGRAAIESLAENYSDGVVVPAFWFALLGLPGLLAYKAINTADSMIGHRSPRYRDFGWASARLDDLVNWPAARLSGFLVAIAAPLVGGSIGNSIRTMFAEASHHRSPNAGWPEAAMAAALGVALAGPRSYGGVKIDDGYMNKSARPEVTPNDIRRSLLLYVGACAALGILVTLSTAVV